MPFSLSLALFPVNIIISSGHFIFPIIPSIIIYSSLTFKSYITFKSEVNPNAQNSHLNQCILTLASVANRVLSRVFGQICWETISVRQGLMPNSSLFVIFWFKLNIKRRR